MISSEIDVDGIIRALGHTRFFHTTQFIVICTSIVIASTNSFFYMFFAITPEYRCNNLTQLQLSQYNISINEINLIYDKCSINIINTDGDISAENRTLDCLNGYYYTTPVDRSIVSQWDLVCNSLGLAESTQTFYTLGQVVSGLLAPCLIEKFGRKPLRVSSHMLLIIFNLIAAFSPFYWLFSSMRFFIGVVREAYILSSVTLVCELYAKEQRIIMSGMFMFIWGIYNCSLGLITYTLKDYGWNKLFLLNAAISGYFIVDFLFLEESLRWLFANSKIKAAEMIVKKAAKQNKVDFDNVWSITLKDTLLQEDVSQVKETSLEPRVPLEVTTVVNHTQPHKDQHTSDFVKLLSIFKSPYLRKVTIIVSIEWAVTTMSLNSILQMLELLVGSIYFNYSMLALLEIISVSLYSILAKRFGHKISLQFWKILVATSVISASLIKILAENSKTMEYVCLVLYFLAISGLNAAAVGDYIYTSELYPTQIRSVGNGFATTFMRMACMAAPFIKLLALAVPWAPGIIIGTGSIVSSILLKIFLPETGNCVLPQTIEEVNRMEHNNKRNTVKVQTIL